MDNIQLTQDCLKTISNFGSTTYQNVCNGTFNIVQWGSIDWVATILAFGMFLFVVRMAHIHKKRY